MKIEIEKPKQEVTVRLELSDEEIRKALTEAIIAKAGFQTTDKTTWKHEGVTYAVPAIHLVNAIYINNNENEYTASLEVQMKLMSDTTFAISPYEPVEGVTLYESGPDDVNYTVREIFVNGTYSGRDISECGTLTRSTHDSRFINRNTNAKHASHLDILLRLKEQVLAERSGENG